MSESDQKRGGGSKLTRSRTVTVRLDPKLHYMAELAARQQRRTLSSFIEWAIEEALREVPMTSHLDTSATASTATSFLWDVDEPDRFVMLALRNPELLNHDEQVLWKLITECGAFWEKYRGHHDQWSIARESFRFPLLRKHWAELMGLARGEGGSPDLLEKLTRQDPDWVPF